MVTENVELSTIDLHYEDHRMKNPGIEARLLTSIMEKGIEEPLEGVEIAQRWILLNGFKRFRCAKKLKLNVVPFVSLAADEATGIIAVLRASNAKSLSILEQARFIDDLHTIQKLSPAEIAQTLSRSKSWVTMRLGLLSDIPQRVCHRLFTGAFPVYCYMYTLRQLLRTGAAKKEEVERFVEATSGKKLSVRDIDQLAHGYFRGPQWFRDQVLAGHLDLALRRMKETPAAPNDANEFERVLLRDLELLVKYMQKTNLKSQDPRIETRGFCAAANLLVGGILSRLGAFTQAMRSLHDRTGKA
jgi:ParB/RepB/Spo0J family partition protein